MNQLEGLNPLKNVHEILAESAGSLEEDVDAAAQSTTCFRLDADLKAAVDVICRRHASNTSAFLRGCCQQLIREYAP